MPVFSEGGVFVGYRGVGTDITQEELTRRELKKSNQALALRNQELERAKLSMERLALRDPLTDLPNRRHFDRRVNEIQQDARGDDTRVLISIDLDNFKHINDTFGHQVGDRLLQHVARSLLALIDADDFVARLGGDEFVVICAREASEDRAAALSEQIVQTFARPFSHDRHVCRFGASVGYAIHPAHTLRDGVKHADAALYDAKKSGRGAARRFQQHLYAAFSNAKRTADEIAESLDNGAFEAFFQPQFDAETLDLTGVEALARWRHPTRGLLSPDKFLPIAEDHGLLDRIDAQIFESAIELCQDAAFAGAPLPKCAVNVSLSRLKSESFLSAVTRRRDCGATLAFELVETSSFEVDDDTVAANLSGLREAGCEIEIDDFGSGFASITSLIKIEPHRLKIDRTLIAPLGSSERHQRLVAAIIELGRTLSVDVIAEGVETWRHVEILREIGCDAFQGFLFARPMSGAALIDFIQAQSWRAARLAHPGATSPAPLAPRSSAL